MYFSRLCDRLLAAVTLRLRNGEMTERELARRIGMSQPHVHNVLKRRRILTAPVADLLLEAFRMSALDLVSNEEWQSWVKHRESRPLPGTFPTPGGPSNPS